MDKLLICKLKKGDEKAFKYIYDRHYLILCKFAQLLTNDSLLSQEIVDDAIFYLWEHRDTIKITHSLRSYLMRSVRNRCLNELNSLSHRTECSFSNFSMSENIDFLYSVFVDINHPLGTLLEKELEKKIKNTIESLPEECRIVFKKSRFEQKKYKEIASELKISVNTVKYHIKNALSYLHTHLDNYL